MHDVLPSYLASISKIPVRGFLNCDSTYALYVRWTNCDRNFRGRQSARGAIGSTRFDDWRIEALQHVRIRLERETNEFLYFPIYFFVRPIPTALARLLATIRVRREGK